MKQRLVYSTGGKVCPTCGWPEDQCRCSKRLAAERAKAGVAGTHGTDKPGKLVAKLRMEKSGRSGKIVTVIYDLPDDAAMLKELSQELKRACGVGGTVVEGGVELQGDQRDRIRPLLTKKGWTVKG